MKIFFSDLDGTLLDHTTYSYAEAEEGISLLKKNNIPLVLVSSKTRQEIEELSRELQLVSPFIFENGGGIAWPATEGEKAYNYSMMMYDIDILGLKLEELKQHLNLVADVMKSKITTIVDMTIDELIVFTGLSQKKAELAQKRKASLPFILSEKKEIGIDELNKINTIVNKKGLSITKGGRFFHLSSKGSSKGAAIKKVVENYAKKSGDGTITSIGIGDSENDIPMFLSVDIPFLVKKPGGTAIKTGLKSIRETRGIGPAGFTEAVKQIIQP
ncbi:MAG: HAD-IIB family hydrolase [bacterium]|nr:HAD-IIB family hydrolase [bacterium]